MTARKQSKNRAIITQCFSRHHPTVHLYQSRKMLEEIMLDSLARNACGVNGILGYVACTDGEFAFLESEPEVSCA